MVISTIVSHVFHTMFTFLVKLISHGHDGTKLAKTCIPLYVFLRIEHLYCFGHLVPPGSNGRDWASRQSVYFVKKRSEVSLDQVQHFR